MSGVVFSIGSKPRLSHADAQALVGLIAADPTPFTTKLAAKVNRAVSEEDAGEVQLDRDEVVELVDALSADPELLLDVPSFRPLYDELIASLG